MAMPLETYAQVRSWAESIKQEITARRMPPWPADRGYGHFRNSQNLTLREQEFFLSWIDGGMPEGEGASPDRLDHRGHWMQGSPDQEFPSELESTDSTDGEGLVWTRYTVELQNSNAIAIRAIDLRIESKSARTAYVSVDASQEYLGGWTPLSTLTPFPDGTAVQLATQSRIAIDVLQDVRERTVTPRLAVYWAKPSYQAVQGLTLVNAEPAAAEVAVTAEKTVSSDLALLGFRIAPAAGNGFVELRARLPNGSTKPLLLAKAYDSLWPVPFVLEEPFLLPAGSVLQAMMRRSPDHNRTDRLQIDFTTVAGGLSRPSDSTLPPEHRHHH